MEKMNSSLKGKLAKASRKLEDSKKEKESLEHELAGAANKITSLTGEKEYILLAQTILHQTISELRGELEEAGPAAIQKYKASSLYRQELMEYAAPYMGKGVKLAIEKIKAKDPTFDPETYGLEMYILPPEADDQEFSSEESDSGVPLTSRMRWSQVLQLEIWLKEQVLWDFGYKCVVDVSAVERKDSRSLVWSSFCFTYAYANTTFVATLISELLLCFAAPWMFLVVLIECVWMC